MLLRCFSVPCVADALSSGIFFCVCCGSLLGFANVDYPVLSVVLVIREALQWAWCSSGAC